MLCSSHPILVAVGFITVVMAPMWHIALHNTNLYGTLVRSYSLGCCSQSSVEASGLNLFMYKLFGLVHICCHLGLYTLGHLGLYIFVAIWACTVWWACTLPFGLVQFGPFGLVCCYCTAAHPILVRWAHK